MSGDSWRSKSGERYPNYVAHIVVDDVALCSTKCARPMLAAFRCEWVDLQSDDHLCTYCRRASDRPHPDCRCKRCLPLSEYRRRAAFLGAS